jgi:hypothetical protein
MQIKCMNCHAFYDGDYRGGESCGFGTECRRKAPVCVNNGRAFPTVRPWDWCLDFVPRTRALGESPNVS